MVCATCGGVVPVERLARYGQARSRAAVNDAFERFLRLRQDWVLCILAVVPLLLIPPLIALAIIGFRWPQTRKIYGNDHVVGLIIIIALLNIVGSAIILMMASDSLLDLTGRSWHDLLHTLQPVQRNNTLRYI